MNITSFSILSIISHNTSQEKNYYTKISVNKIRKLLATFHGIHVKRRWIFECIRRLIKKKYLTRHPRHFNRSDGTVGQRSSMLSFTKPGCMFMLKKGVTSVKKIMKKWLKKEQVEDKRPPNREDFFQSHGREITPGELRGLEDLVNMAIKPFPA